MHRLMMLMRSFQGATEASMRELCYHRGGGGGGGGTTRQGRTLQSCKYLLHHVCIAHGGTASLSGKKFTV